MRPRVTVIAVLVVLVYGCTSTAPPPAPEPGALHGIASWYGEEFAGRTTANGEIFDPLGLTAAHRTLPFGTVVDVTNLKTKQTVRVRVNDRGPYIGGRVIDLSYAAAKVIGLIEPGIGEVDFAIVKMGSGEREPPAPFEVKVAEAPKTAPEVASPPPADDAPQIEFPLPAQTAVVDRVEVEPRKQVADDGRTIVRSGVVQPSGLPPAPKGRPEARTTRGQFLVQVGAFAVEANAKLLQERLVTIGQKAWIEGGALYRVRIGPFPTRDEAMRARTALEANGVSAIIVSE